MKMLSFKDAVEALQGHGTIIYPTETFFAIGGSALNGKVVASVYSAKVRNRHLPLPVIIGDMSQLEMLTHEVETDIKTIISKFWPGPLTIILPAKAELPPLLTAGTSRVAVRLSSHFEASNLANSAGFPLISSSANLSGEEPVTRVEDLAPALVKAVAGGVYTGGEPPQGGKPSTIIEMVGMTKGENILHILREGAIPAAQFIKLGFTCYIK